MFRILCDPSSGSVEQVENSSSQLVTPGAHTTGPKVTLLNTDYAHKILQVISVKHIQHSLRMDYKGSETCRSF